MSEILICLPHMRASCMDCIKAVMDYQDELDAIINQRIDAINLTMGISRMLYQGGVNVNHN